MARMLQSETVYKVVELFSERCVRTDKSLLWPEEDVWTQELLDRFWQVFVEKDSGTEKSFMGRFRSMYADEPRQVQMILADLMVMFGIFPSTDAIGPVRKAEYVDTVREWKELPSPDAPTWEMIYAALGEGVGGIGTYFLQAAPYHIAFVARFAQALKRYPDGLGKHLVARDLADEVIQEMKNHTAKRVNAISMRHVMLHLMFPEEFERIASHGHKRKILAAYRDEFGIDSDTDIDEALRVIRNGLMKRHSLDTFDFYEPEFKAFWDPPKSPQPKDASQPKVDNERSIEEVHDAVSTNLNSIEGLSETVFLDQLFLQEVANLLVARMQLIFEGPPGSGKTFVAEKFARWFTGQPVDNTPLDHHVEIVQFHQSYGYEDFVQGIRPETNLDNQLVYRVRDGIFLDMVERAKANPEDRFVLIIDEINRGNLSRVFGELLLLLEYRGQRVRLPYGSGDAAYLTIPENLYIIGTMNTADRSLAQIDYALRRRFYFVRFMPVENGRAEVYENWLAQNVDDAPDRARLRELFVSLNHGIRRHLNTDDLQVGHSYFMQDGIETDVVFDRVWRRAVRPLLEEYLHHHRNRDEILADLTPERLTPTPAAIEEVEPDTEAVEPGQV